MTADEGPWPHVQQSCARILLTDYAISVLGARGGGGMGTLDLIKQLLN